jgi:hypothetical protein
MSIATITEKTSTPETRNTATQINEAIQVPITFEVARDKLAEMKLLLSLIRTEAKSPEGLADKISQERNKLPNSIGHIDKVDNYQKELFELERRVKLRGSFKTIRRLSPKYLATRLRLAKATYFSDRIAREYTEANKRFDRNYAIVIPEANPTRTYKNRYLWQIMKPDKTPLYPDALQISEPKAEHQLQDQACIDERLKNAGIIFETPEITKLRKEAIAKGYTLLS